MSSRRPLQPIPARSAEALSTRCSRTAPPTRTADGNMAMDAHAPDDAHDAGSVVSGLTSLSGDDDFERLMIQNARDERRLKDARSGRAQPFRNARTNARVGLTMDNLERNDAQNSSVGNVNGNANGSRNGSRLPITIKSPPSSSGSTRSDPAIHAPAGWGRKGRSSRDWMKSITRDAQPPQAQQPLHRQQTALDDSPLSHKSFNQPHDDSEAYDLTFELNEASMIVSTPYIPRNTKLDDIREREIESLREQRVATARLDRIRENSPEEKRHHYTDASPQEQGSPVRRLRKRTNLWQSLGKSQPELGVDNLPITVHRKSTEVVPTVERHVVASAEKQPARPITNQRTDSQDLLRQLAKVSNTPSPKAPAPYIPSQPTHNNTSNTVPDEREDAVNETPAPKKIAPSIANPQEQLPREQRQDTPHDGTTPDAPSSAPEITKAIDATPMPQGRTILNPKTPVVMGGWVDTPGPRTTQKPTERPRPQPQSPKRSGLREDSPLNPTTAPAEDQQPTARVPEAVQPSLPRPQLPSSALHALVQEARASHDYGDDTIHSLEDLMAPLGDNDIEDDTLQGLPLPTAAPRNEAERGRQAEVEQIHRLNQHLRATSTGIRDISRGMRRVGTRIEHIEVEETGKRMPIIVRDLNNVFSPWIWFRSFFWDENLKTLREAKDAPLKMWGGVTLLGIVLTLSFIWWASEAVACEMFCHPEYARYSPHPFAVNMDAPERGVVIPTLVYRALFKNWSTPTISPVASLFSWIWATIASFTSGTNIVGLSRASYTATASGEPIMAAHTQAAWRVQKESHEEDSWDWSMTEDEILRR